MSALGRLFWLAWAFICTAATVDVIRGDGTNLAIACYVLGAALAFNLATRHD